MTKKAILMSIRPQFASKIFDGTKTVELRRVKPRFLSKDDLIFIYVSSPVKSLMGAFTVSNIAEKSIISLWGNVKNNAGVSRHEFLNYFQGLEKGVAIFIKDVWLLPKPIHLEELKKEVKGFYAPQSFRYTSITQLDSFK